ncbi:MAG: sigma-70 family RNA polymerase sigma factor [Labilithrix sp.]|nr:sigma-70 family RNA polymerase sigma factor [Labilithrix sp.]
MSTPDREQDVSTLTSFDEVYDRHVVFVWRTLRALGVPDAAIEDAVQDVFVVVHRRLPEFESRARLTSWLFGIARRVAKNHRFKRRPSEELADVEEHVRDERPTPYETAVQTEAVALLERLLDRLDDNQRICFVLMDIEQLTAEEVASLLEINVNTVYSRRRLARLELNRLTAHLRRSE